MISRYFRSASPYTTWKTVLGVFVALVCLLELAITLPPALARINSVNALLQTIDIHALVQTGNYVVLNKGLRTYPLDVNKLDAQGRTPLHVAAIYGQTAIAELLLEHNALLDQQVASEKQGTALLYAVAYNHPDIVRLLLERGALVNLPAASGITPLHVAAAQGQVAMIKLLLHYHADPTAQAQGGATPLQFALQTHHAEAAKVLAAGTPP